MNPVSTLARQRDTPSRRWPAALAWAAGWVTMLWLDGAIDLSNLAMVLVLSSAVASLWLTGAATIIVSALAVAAFNWAFVPPRHTFSVELHQHAILLAAMLVVNWIISALVIGQRLAAWQARLHADREVQLRSWVDTLRDAADPAAHASALHDALAGVAEVPVAVIVSTSIDGESDREPAALHVGQADADQKEGLSLCMREGRPLGPGTGRYEEQPDWYLPLRGRDAALGAAVLRGLGERRSDPGLRAHAQALCDQMGLALQRRLATAREQAAREQAQQQGVRNALLAAIAHDFRTPLATIMGAASSLEEQAERLSLEQRRKLAAGIVDEAERLSRLTDNTLQLARLDAPQVELRCDWESAEEIVGEVLRHARRRDPTRRLRVRLEPELPLLWCDAMLISQLLTNLVDNALEYSPNEAPVELLVRRVGANVVLAVRDCGPGVALPWRERIFQVFQRGAESLPAVGAPRRKGAGVGLAVCRAIARAHGGTLTLRARGHGGSSFECALPLREPPSMPAPEPAS